MKKRYEVQGCYLSPTTSKAEAEWAVVDRVFTLTGAKKRRNRFNGFSCFYRIVDTKTGKVIV